MEEYLRFLNDLGDAPDLDEIERFWIERVKQFFAAQPLRIRFDAASGLRSTVRGILDQAIDRDKESEGTSYSGAVLQHLVGGKLSCAFGEGMVEHNSFSTADISTGRVADFPIGELAIHVTTAPSEALIDRCKENLDDGYRPVVVTTEHGLAVAVGLASNRGIEPRIDVFEVEQFIALNLYEFGAFRAEDRFTTISDFVRQYNYIVEECETDPSLQIQIN